MTEPTCATCLLHAPGAECRRHAPVPNHDEANLIVHWNRTKEDQRCGGFTDKDRGVPCGDCIDWYRPAEGIRPSYRSGLSEAWWNRAGYCTKAAPGTNYRESMDTHWGVTHAELGGCGDGTPVNPPDPAAAGQP